MRMHRKNPVDRKKLAQASGGFRTDGDPKTIVREFERVQIELKDEIIRELVGENIVEFVNTGMAEVRLATHLMDFMKALGNFESRQDKLVVQMREWYEKIKTEMGIISNETVRGLVGRLPELRARVRPELTGPIEPDMAAINAFYMTMDRATLNGNDPDRHAFVLGNQLGHHMQRAVRMREALKEYMFCSMISTIESAQVYASEGLREDCEKFMSRLFQHADSLAAQAREARGGLPEQQLACFKFMVYAFVAKSIEIGMSYKQQAGKIDRNMIAWSILECPYILALEENTVDRISQLAKTPTGEIARAICKNPQWILPEDDFSVLEKLIGLFHSILKDVMPCITPVTAIRIVRSATAIYISDLWEDLALLLMDSKTAKTAEQVLTLIEKGNFQDAKVLIAEGKNALDERMTQSKLARVGDEYPDAKPEELQLLLRTFGRFEALGIENLGNIRRKETGAIIRMAKAAERLTDDAARAVFKSPRNRKMFALALEKPGSEEIIEKLNEID
ncbi:hypothetical protein HZC07_03975, partial [Candidatus Micrarchaeota archaeon]|nr:hypothetical protein [Candidatus Micrarchaeota archaeon]